MAKVLVIGPAARRQIAAADRWWKEHRASSNAITDELDGLFSHLETSPYMGQAAENPRRPGLRRFYLDRIDYHVYYRVDERRAEITITSIRHARRRPIRM